MYLNHKSGIEGWKESVMKGNISRYQANAVTEETMVSQTERKRAVMWSLIFIRASCGEVRYNPTNNDNPPHAKPEFFAFEVMGMKT